MNDELLLLRLSNLLVAGE